MTLHSKLLVDDKMKETQEKKLLTYRSVKIIVGRREKSVYKLFYCNVSRNPSLQAR